MLFYLCQSRTRQRVRLSSEPTAAQSCFCTSLDRDRAEYRASPRNVPVLYRDPHVEEQIGSTGQLLSCQDEAWSCCCCATYAVLLYLTAQTLSICLCRERLGSDALRVHERVQWFTFLPYARTYIIQPANLAMRNGGLPNLMLTHQHSALTPKSCPRAARSKQEREGGTTLSAPTLLPG